MMIKVVILIKFCSGYMSNATSHVIVLCITRSFQYTRRDSPPARQQINRPKGGLSVYIHVIHIRQKNLYISGVVMVAVGCPKLEAIRRIFWTENNAFPMVRVYTTYTHVLYDS